MKLIRKKTSLNTPFYYTNFRHKGQRIERSTGCTNKRDARAFAAKLKTELVLQDQNPVAFNNHTFKEARLRYLKNHKNDDKIEWLGSQLDTYLLVDIDEAVIYKLNQKLEARGNGPHTIKRKLAVLRSILNLCRNRKWLQNVPYFDMPACPNNERHRNTTDNEIQKVLAVLPNYLKAPILFFIASGFRKSELVNLKWQQVSLDRSTITLSKQKNNRTSKVYLSAWERQIIKSQEGMHPEYVFSNPNTELGNLGDFKTAWTAAREKTGLYKKGSKNNLTIHDLRHMHANNLVRAGASDVIVSSILRHSDLRLVKRYSNQNADIEVDTKENASKAYATLYATNLLETRL